jgi:starch synthase
MNDHETPGTNDPRVALFTREYPPEIYGGAGTHVEFLARELARLIEVTVHAWGSDRPARPGEPPVIAYRPWEALAGSEPHAAALQALSIDLEMAARVGSANLVHSHTWYANLAGHLARLVHDIPHVATVHSLEPMRPWKAEQLGGGYAVSSFAERTGLEGADAIVAVSSDMRRDLLRCYPAINPGRVSVIHNGIDTDEFRRDPGTELLDRYGIDPERPSVVFVGRITRQKGLAHLLDAAELFDAHAQLVLVAGSPDTREIAAETAAHVERLRATRGVVWVAERTPRADLIQILSHASVFVCPSVYEPLGIVNLEAMACEAPVVATNTGGIPEVVDDGVTGLLVPFEPRDDGSRAPVDPAAFARAIAERIDDVLGNPERAATFGRAGRVRAVEHFSWAAIAAQTVDLYRGLLASEPGAPKPQSHP